MSHPLAHIGRATFDICLKDLIIQQWEPQESREILKRGRITERTSFNSIKTPMN